ncbi:hypothetical protein GCM10009837_52470 [Streptomyces durmitorensis]
MAAAVARRVARVRAWVRVRFMRTTFGVVGSGREVRAPYGCASGAACGAGPSCGRGRAGMSVLAIVRWPCGFFGEGVPRTVLRADIPARPLASATDCGCVGAAIQ